LQIARQLVAQAGAAESLVQDSFRSSFRKTVLPQDRKLLRGRVAKLRV
jgi:hypothetical protein